MSLPTLTTLVSGDTQKLPKTTMLTSAQVIDDQKTFKHATPRIGNHHDSAELTKNHLKSHRSTKNSHKQHRHINQQYLNLKKKKKSHSEYQEAANTTAMDIVLLFHYQNSIAMTMMMTKVSSNVFSHIPTSFKSINCSTQYNQNQPTEQSENKK